MAETSRSVGVRTLARGLRALELVTAAHDGLTVQEVAERLDLHRSITSSLLSTLADSHLVARGGEGRYSAGVGLAAFAGGTRATLRAAAEPVMRELATELGATISLLVIEGADAVALLVMEPRPRPTFSHSIPVVGIRSDGVPPRVTPRDTTSANTSRPSRSARLRRCMR
ncbi:helix-turn-helix domain-containing protein [Streptomyces sp. NPDC002928]|uniref:helix-turn-helix domain-containing protein n=1 Tax=Streptomyces sp. NPDC002928 TaxID=3154440 RepID=UPI0033B79956